MTIPKLQPQIKTKIIPNHEKKIQPNSRINSDVKKPKTSKFECVDCGKNLKCANSLKVHITTIPNCFCKLAKAWVKRWDILKQHFTNLLLSFWKEISNYKGRFFRGGIYRLY